MTTDNIIDITNNAQKSFDEKYITSQEIVKRLGVSRTAIHHARVKGYLPESIHINSINIYVWERSIVEPYLNAWSTIINARKRFTA